MFLSLRNVFIDRISRIGWPELVAGLLLGATPSIATSQMSYDVTLEDLLREMVDLERLASRPRLPFVQAMASSRDPASQREGTDAWFANLDFGHYIRQETNSGRTEHVMADLVGPGAINRIFSPNAIGTIRFYFDGETAPRITENFGWMLSGNAEPFREPLAYNVPSGQNFYYPLPYATRLKVTLEEPDPERLGKHYYAIGYRTYSPGTRVESWSYGVGDRARPEFERTKRLLQNPDQLNEGRKLTRYAASVATIPGAQQTLLDVAGPRAMYELKIKVRPISSSLSITPLPWEHPEQLHNIVRTHVLTIEIDDEVCVRVPIGDFAGTAPGLTAYRTLPMEVTRSGEIVCRFVMPFERFARIGVVNWGSAPARIEIEAKAGTFARFGDHHLFRAQYSGFREWTRPYRDLDVATMFGEGQWLGCTLHVGNPSPAWWGEGDEKVWVDGESLPSTFGTGSEDYFGFGWGSNERFERPFHAQTFTTGRQNYGHASAVRWHIPDPIPFNRSLRFTIEKWHLAEELTDYDFASFWYARPAGSGPREVFRGLLKPRKFD